jgi:hypothetical protein
MCIEGVRDVKVVRDGCEEDALAGICLVWRFAGNGYVGTAIIRSVTYLVQCL